MQDIRVLPEQQTRVETGPTRFGEDWTGVFIRGDAALPHAMQLQRMMNGEVIGPVERMQIESLIAVLASCVECGPRL